MTADTIDDLEGVGERPDDLEGVGERDLMMGITVGVVMAFGAIALAIIFSVT
jgi:hypothetical protein